MTAIINISLWFYMCSPYGSQIEGKLGRSALNNPQTIRLYIDSLFCISNL